MAQQDRPMLSLHIGGAGMRIASSMWPMIYKQYDLSEDGDIDYRNVDSATHVFFDQQDVASNFAKFQPRSILLDTEPTPIEDAIVGPLAGLIPLENCVAADVGPCGTFERGFYGRPLSGERETTFLECLRNQLERADITPNFNLFHSYGGGTGSGLTSILAGYLKGYMPQGEVFTFGVLPSFKNTIQTYNCVLAINELHLTGNHFLFKDRALENKQNKKEHDSENHFIDLYRGISCSVAAMATAVKTNSLPQLRTTDMILKYGGTDHARYPLVSYAEVKTGDDPLTVPELTEAAFNRTACMLNCNPQSGRISSLCTLYSGPMRFDEVYEPIIRFSQRYPGINEIPKIKWNLNQKVPDEQQQALCTISANTAVVQLFEELREAYIKPLRRRESIHLYTSTGMELEDFEAAGEELNKIIEYFKVLHASLPDTLPAI